MSRVNNRGLGGKPWRFSQAPKPVRHSLLKDKAGALYDQLALAHRAGAIQSYGYGEGYGKEHELRWNMDGVTYATDQTWELETELAAKLRMRRIASIAFGPYWCGYRSVIVTYTTGQTVVERYDGCRVVIEELAEEVAS